MPCSNCVRYSRRCVILNAKSQRCGECVRRGSKCDALQASISDLESLRLEEERLKLERDLAFEAAMAGLERVRVLEKRQQELRTRGMEMLRRGLSSLDELDAVEAKELESAAARDREVPAPGLDSFDLPDLDPAFWDNLGFSGKIPQASQGN